MTVLRHRHGRQVTEDGTSAHIQTLQFPVDFDNLPQSYVRDFGAAAYIEGSQFGETHSDFA